MKTIKPHIRIYSDNSQTILQVDTWELKDMVEDYLNEEFEFVYEYVQVINPELNGINRESYNLHYSNKYKHEQIEQAVARLEENRVIEIVRIQQMQANGKFYCPCCGYNTLDEIPNGSYQICEVCYWEDDPIQQKDQNFQGGANKVSLTQGRLNFEEYGACEKEMIKNVKMAVDKYLRDPDWKK